MFHPQIEAVRAWAENTPEVAALVLVGSHARRAASPDSDIDLILLTRDPRLWVADTRWISTFGEPVDRAIEAWGEVTSVRARYRDGSEIEFGITGLDWGAGGDPGSARVLRDGAIVLLDRGLDLAARFRRSAGDRLEAGSGA